ncbi:hypothetical protein COU20_03190 [Candidatus Kaiserbacteria bacterium CG10_big_fil_rev_8_21_14_0_10_59_10]|uniref:Uncharacterized protein n=1 Tax=Candidatus Kaiserbacteria bacterium CG10_big_fil_rev_8_21_14_0_10_59_10 TaxID=1974612 RepID=A0A2H0U798_9BACT|nr:MAG: hypothetical protein COU20_03190 [Candidatus Kaiserbacteria bacterium CG10_big_fil_rev_8_21_14_0_10_59_10]
MHAALRILAGSLLGVALAPLAFAFAQDAPASVEEQHVYVARIEGEITAGSAQYLARVHERAVEADADLFLLLLDTPGGLVKSTQDIVGMLLESPIPTAVFVHRSGGSAFSAGTYMLLAGEHAAVHPNASFGAAQPIALGIGGEGTDEKALAAMEAFMRSIAEARSRDALLAERFVNENLTLTGSEALVAGIIDSTPESVDGLLEELGYAGSSVREIEPTIFERALAVLSLPLVAPLLISIASLGLIFSIRTGEFELLLVFVPLLFIALWALGTLSLSTVGIILFLCALALLAFEILSPGIGLPGIAGGMLLLASIFFLANEPYFTFEMHGVFLYAAVTILLGFLAFFFWVSQAAVSSLNAPVQTGIESLAGKEGRAATGIGPDGGEVLIEAYRWHAKSSENIAAGEPVVVERVEKGVCHVRALKG